MIQSLLQSIKDLGTLQQVLDLILWDLFLVTNHVNVLIKRSCTNELKITLCIGQPDHMEVFLTGSVFHHTNDWQPQIWRERQIKHDANFHLSLSSLRAIQTHLPPPPCASMPGNLPMLGCVFLTQWQQNWCKETPRATWNKEGRGLLKVQDWPNVSHMPLANCSTLIFIFRSISKIHKRTIVTSCVFSKPHPKS